LSEVSKRAVKKFFKLLFSGKLSEAERTLQRIKKRYKLGDDDGYYMALYGIYYTYINDDRDSYIFKLWERFLNNEGKRSLSKSFRELLKTMYQPPEKFLKAWLDLIGFIDELPVPHKIKKEMEAKQRAVAQAG